jgi:hypothetical protein
VYSNGTPSRSPTIQLPSSVSRQRCSSGSTPRSFATEQRDVQIPSHGAADPLGDRQPPSARVIRPARSTYRPDAVSWGRSPATDPSCPLHLQRASVVLLLLQRLLARQSWSRLQYFYTSRYGPAGKDASRVSAALPSLIFAPRMAISRSIRPTPTGIRQPRVDNRPENVQTRWPAPRAWTFTAPTPETSGRAWPTDPSGRPNSPAQTRSGPMTTQSMRVRILKLYAMPGA